MKKNFLLIIFFFTSFSSLASEIAIVDINFLLKKINSILIDYSKENNISTTLDKKYVIMTKSENDITEKILEILNK